MSMPHFKYVLVGAGGAGSAAAVAIRERDSAGSILLVGQESNRPYYRPALNKEFLNRSKARMDIVVEPVGWYDEKHVELRTGRRAAHLDTSRRMITLDNGDEIAFDKLLLATGASPRPLRVLGSELPNVFHLRTIQDCDRLHNAIDKARSEGRVHSITSKPGTASRGRAVVIGAGLLALETAATLRHMDLQVDLVLGRQPPWGKFSGENTGRFLSLYLAQHDIAVHVGLSPERMEGDGRVQRVVLSNGESLDCDFVLVAVGVVSNRDLVRNTPIAAEKAILVDDHCRTNVQDIYAAGDCAAVLDPLFGKYRVIDHWDSARYCGAIAGANMAGDDVRYDTVSAFSSSLFDLNMVAWGEPRLVDHRLLRGTPNVDLPDFAEIGVASDGRVAQVLAIGRTKEHELFRKLVQMRLNVRGREEIFKDPSQELASLMQSTG